MTISIPPPDVQAVETSGRFVADWWDKLKAAFDAINGATGVWTAFTPAITASAGTFTTVSATGRYILVGKTVHFTIQITVTTNGTAATAILATIPVTALNTNNAFAGRETALTGDVLSASLTSATAIFIVKYDGTYLGGNGAVLVVSGTYEAA